jgi:hypothetical protein
LNFDSSNGAEPGGGGQEWFFIMVIYMVQPI